MTDKPDQALVAALIELTENCQALFNLLENDKTHFIKNEHVALQTSNTKKLQIIEKICSLGSVLDPEKISTLPQKMAAVKNEIMQCYQSVITNNYIVHANLDKLKGIWDELNAMQKEKLCIYDRAGNTI